MITIVLIYHIDYHLVIILPNVIFAVNPLPTPLLSMIKVINIWFLDDVPRDGA